MWYLPSLSLILPQFALFCTLFALSEFFVNQIFRVVRKRMHAQVVARDGIGGGDGYVGKC